MINLDKPSKESKGQIKYTSSTNSKNKAYSLPNINSEPPKLIQNQILRTPPHEKRVIEFGAPKKDKTNIVKKYTLRDLDSVKKKIRFDEIDFGFSSGPREETKSENKI